MTTFKDLGIRDELCEVLRYQGIREATPVQEQAIPVVRAGRDCIVQAQTGTGKTLAFLLPIIEKLKPQAEVAQALVVTPTRELAIQIAKVAKTVGEAAGISSLVIYGGQDIERQKQKLRRHPQLIIGTPGRLLDHLRRRTIDLSQVNKVVLDEADEMMRLGFIEDVELLLKETAPDRQLMLFSATMPDRIKALSLRYMQTPENIAVKSEHVTLDAIEQVIVDTTEETKIDKLCELINQDQPYLAMVFCHTKQRAHMVTMALAARGYLVDELHGDLSQVQRALVLKRFRKAELQILCATDIAARGLDIEGVTHVFNYDIPHDAESYIHRIGRTGRAGEHGKAVTFVNARQYDLLRRIESGIKSRIEKQRSERGRRHKEKQEQILKEIRDKRQEHKAKKKPLSKYANRKGAAHKGRNDRSRRQKPHGTKTNMSRRSKMGRH
ncbi:DEAD/DEAH box helicase [Mitsuokella sp. AF21-1AC]|uniref:DEAD/DEAH box helicase n=1 Tax=Mitsuokella sp. AF21-1AC TaxID=2292235 RepID=UPI000E55045F|nr:DEAD/DEAH box helicase [Mitsuokella sp. AF21-1AC]RGS71322.1 ATP-dependent helicase [Mitsuokella sp. AF21-1AC]